MKNPDDDLVGIGSHYGSLVDLLEPLANPAWVQRLLAMASAWRNRDHGHDKGVRRSHFDVQLMNQRGY